MLNGMLLNSHQSTGSIGSGCDRVPDPDMPGEVTKEGQDGGWGRTLRGTETLQVGWP